MAKKKKTNYWNALAKKFRFWILVLLTLVAFLGYNLLGELDLSLRITLFWVLVGIVVVILLIDYFTPFKLITSADFKSLFQR